MNSIFISIRQSLLLVVFGLIFLFLFTHQALAQQSPFSPTTVPLNGYAWSSNIGWISFNCLTGGATGNNVCASRSDYKVEIRPNGNLVGYAWSSNIGWIRFGGLSNFPTGSGTVAQNAHLALLNGQNYEMRGWARACAANSGSDGCGNAVTRNEGWDGWISLKGVSPNYTTRFNATGPVTSPRGWAWGSSVIGWVDMSSYLSIVAPIRIESFGKAPGETPRVGDTPAFDNVRLLTSVTGVRENTTVPYTITFNGTTRTGNYRAGSVAGTGTYTPALMFNNVPAGTPITATLRVGTTDNFDTRTLTLNLTAAPPVITVTARPALVRRGDTTEIEYTVNSPYDVQCTITGGGMNTTVNIDGSPSATTGSRTTPPVNAFTRFTVTCTAPGIAPVTETVDVSVAATISEQ